MKKCRRIRKAFGILVLLAVLLPLAGYGLSNLYLMSPKGRAFLGNKITGISGLEASVEGASWSPWNGVTVYGLRIEQPVPLKEAIDSPLLAVEAIRISPVWEEFAKRRLMIRAVDFRSPRISAPIELLSQLPSTEAAPQMVARAPEIAANVDPGPPSGPAASVPSGPQPADPEIRTISPDPVPKPPESIHPTIWVTMTDARLRVVSTSSAKPLFDVRNIGGKCPLGGKSANSEIRIGPVESFGKTLVEKLTIPLRWDGGILRTDVVPTGFSPIACDLQGSVGLTNGIPFQIKAIINEQSEKEIELPDPFAATLGSVAGQGRFEGFLLAPGTWQGQFLARALDVNGRFQSHENHFQNAHVLVIFRNAILSCPDARLIGETTSVLGNGTLLKDGRVAGIARIVSSPDKLVAISKITHPDQAAPNLTPLSTPQRSALDLQIFGRPGNLFYRPDPAADAIPLN